MPEVFKSNPNESRGINIPEEYTPEIDFSNMGGMFPGMGGMGGLDGLGNLGDLDGMDDLDDDEQITEDNDNNVIDAEIIEDKKDK